MDLQLDYWMTSTKEEKETSSGVVSLSGLSNIGDSSQKLEFKKSGPGSGYGDGGSKASIKTSIWRMQVQRLGVQSVSDQPTFSMQYWLKEKKSKGTQLKLYTFLNALISVLIYHCKAPAILSSNTNKYFSCDEIGKKKRKGKRSF